MADLVSPDQIRSRSFRTTFRGFDQAEVAEFLDWVSRTVEYLDRERARVGADADEQTDGDLQTEFQRVSAEIGEVLEAARLAAEGMRDRAAAEAADWRRSAEEDSAKAREEAQSDAEALRGDAWSTAKAMLDQSQAEARNIGEAAEKDALAVVGHSERESHKKLASARRESDEMVRTAKMESERLLVNARSQHDEIIEAARKQADAAQERARALEVRRDELLAELETVRSRIHAMEADIEERRKPVPADPAQPASVRLIPAEGSGETEAREVETKWSPTDTIRIIPATRRKIEPDEPVDAASLADEVRRLRDEAALAELAGEPDEAVARESDEELSVKEHETPVAEPTDISEAVAEPADEVSNIEQPETVDEVVQQVQEKPWALDSLFATLRSEPPETTPVAAPEYPPEPVKAEASQPEPAADAKPGKSASPPDGDAIADRDRLLLPITNRVLRSVKRQLTEAQNITLEDVRVNETWNPESVDLAERVRGDLLVLVQESYAAGQSATGSILGVETGRAKPAKADIPDHSGEFSSTMTEALASVAGSAGEQGPRALSASLSRIYRAWRTDEAERRLRGYAVGAFHRGVLAGAAGAGATQIAWVMSGRGCTTCRAADQVGTVAIGSDFPGIDGVPPVHPGCACTIVPI
jgi:DivIVA domain-containing protein